MCTFKIKVDDIKKHNKLAHNSYKDHRKHILNIIISNIILKIIYTKSGLFKQNVLITQIYIL